MFGFMVALSAGAAMAGAPDDRRVVPLGSPTGVTLPTGEPLPIPGQTDGIRIREDGAVCVDVPFLGEVCRRVRGGSSSARTPGDGEGCPSWGCGSNGTLVDGLVLPLDAPATAVTLPTGEHLPVPSEPVPPPSAIRFNPDGSMCIDFPWGEVCSPPTGGGGCTDWECGSNGTLVDGLALPLDGPRTTVQLPSGERVAL